MKKIDKIKNVQKANLIAEQLYLENKGIVNELFGFSKKEKQAKALKQDIEKAMLEIDGLDVSGLFREVSRKLSNEEYKKLSEIIKNNLINYLPTFVKICPEVLEDNGGSTNAVGANFDYKGDTLRGITYSPLSSIIGTQISDKSKGKLKQYLINKTSPTSVEI